VVIGTGYGSGQAPGIQSRGLYGYLGMGWMNGSFGKRLVLCLTLALGTAMAVLGTVPGGASASTAPPHRVRPEVRTAPGAKMSLAQAPAGLRAVVGRALGAPAVAGGAFQQAKLAAADGAPGAGFGVSVAISGFTAVVGAPSRNADTGAAYVFVRSGAAWSQQAELTASDGFSSDRFGISVAISGPTVVVGAATKNNETGAAYVFVRSGTAWHQQAKLTASDAHTSDNFGISVAICGPTVVVGADSKHSFTGAAYVFVRSGTAWHQQAKLTAADGKRGSFGDAVAISGSTLVVGADGKNFSTGAAYVFVRSSTAWHQQARLTAADPAQDSVFGDAVAVSGPTVVVGANHVLGSDTGAAYVFVRSGTAWSQQAKLTAPGPATIDLFGTSVAILGSAAVVGAPGQTSPGAAYVFVRSGTAWSQRAKLTASDGVSRDFFGDSVAILRSAAVVGAPNNNRVTGAAYVFVNV
jgi:hypothetical protein